MKNLALKSAAALLLAGVVSMAATPASAHGSVGISIGSGGYYSAYCDPYSAYYNPYYCNGAYGGSHGRVVVGSGWHGSHGRAIVNHFGGHRSWGGHNSHGGNGGRGHNGRGGHRGH